MSLILTTTNQGESRRRGQRGRRALPVLETNEIPAGEKMEAKDGKWHVCEKQLSFINEVGDGR